MVSAFEDRFRHNSLMHRSVAATAATYLDSLASVFRHGMGTPTTNLRTDVDFIRTLLDVDLITSAAASPSILEPENGDETQKLVGDINRIVAKADKALNRLLGVGAQISGFAGEFAHSISGFGNFGRMDLVRLVNETILLVKQSLLLTTDADISIDVGGADRADVFCSPLIKQHLYCLLHNAILAIQERTKTTPDPGGVINISIGRFQPPDESQEVQLNEKVRLTIRDNGTGVTSIELDRLRRFQPGTRFRKSRGLGYALPATQRYVASIGGTMSLDSAEGKFFEATILLDPYRKDLHDALSVELS